MKLKSAFIVKDPKTYINAEEAWYDFSGKKDGALLFIIIPKKDPNNTLPTFDEVIDPSKWEEIIWYKSYSNYKIPSIKRRMMKSRIYKWLINGREYIYNYLDKRNLNKIAKKYSPVDKVFSGHKNTQEHLAKALNPNELYIMDSGLKNRVQSNGYIGYREYYRRKPLKNILRKIAGLKVFDREKTKFYTSYGDSIDTKHEIVHNTFEYHTKLIQKKDVGDLIFFVSSPVYLQKGVEIQNYIEFIRSIFKKLNLELSNMVYIPHPIKEKKEDINFIVDKLGCRVDSRKIPIEAKITKHEKLPYMCISPHSSAIVNLASLVGDKVRIICAWHYEFDCFQLFVDWKNDVLKNENIQIVPIEETAPLFGFNKNPCTEPILKNYKEWLGTFDN